MDYKHLYTIAISLMTFTVSGQSLSWVKSLGNVRETALAQDVNGDIFVTGYFSAPIDLDGGPEIYELEPISFIDGFLAKYDSEGNILWAIQFSGGDGSPPYSASWIECFSVKVDAASNVYITGRLNGSFDLDGSSNSAVYTSSSESDFFIAKYSNYGDFQWAQIRGGLNFDYGTDLAFDNSNMVYWTGTFQGSVDFDPGPNSYVLDANGLNDIYVTKFNPDGGFLWAFNLGGTDGDDPESIDVDQNGNIAITGFFRNTVDFDPGPGTYNLTAEVGLEMFVAMYDTDGSFLWANPALGGGADRGNAIRFDHSGHVFVLGEFWGTADFDPGDEEDLVSSVTSNASDIFLAKYDVDGTYLWAKNIGSSSWDIGLGIDIDNSDHLYIVGSVRGEADFDLGSGTVMQGVSSGNNQACLAKYSNDGDYEWSMVLEGMNNSSSGFAIVVDDFGNSYVTGEYFNPTDFDPNTDSLILSTTGSYSNFLAKYVSCIDSYASMELQICEGEPIQGFEDLSFDSSGIYEIVVNNTAGCDSFITLDLTIFPSYEIIVEETICLGDTTFFQGEQITTNGLHQVFYIAENGCDSILVLDLSFWPAYEIQEPISFCTGDTVTYNDLSIFESGDYIFNYSTINGCDSVIILQAIELDLPNINLGADITLTTMDSYEFSVTDAFTSIEWQDGSTGSNYVFNGNDFAPGEHIVSVTVADNNGCIATDEVVVTILLSSPTQEPEWSEGITLFPNPTSGNIFISEPLSGAVYTINNLAGQVVCEGKINSTHVGDLSVPAGVYFLRLELEDEFVVRRFVKL